MSEEIEDLKLRLSSLLDLACRTDDVEIAITSFVKVVRVMKLLCEYLQSIGVPLDGY